MLLRHGTPSGVVNLCTLVIGRNCTVYNGSDLSFSEAIFQIVGQYVTVKGVGAPLLSELLEMYSARVRGDGCSLSLSLAHIISISCSFEFCGRLFCLQVWMMPSVTVNGMKCICYYALLRVWHACCKFLCLIDFGSCVWGLDFGIPSGVLDLVIVRKCTL